MTIHGCTIIARNYLAAARVLARSFISHHPDGTFTTLVIDDREAQIDGSREPFEVVRPAELGFEPAELNRFAAMYDVMELATALKPWLLEHLLKRWGEEVIYLDPDIVVYAPLREILDLAAHSELVLTPHVTKPMKRDGLTVTETHILASGIFNLGFIAIGHRSEEFLEFWKERLRRECVVDPLNMRFVDQRWVDFVPGIFDLGILRDSSYNVAYWNLDQRDLTREDGQYLVDGRPLRFFHFSGYDPGVPEMLSRHQGENPRILLSAHPILAKLCAEYAALLRSEGHRTGSVAVRYGYSRTENGLTLDRPMRIAYREALRDAEREGLRSPPNPFEDADRFIDWLSDPSPGGRISRYLMALWSHGPELRERFPSVEYRDRESFLAWCATEASAGRIDYRLIPKQHPFDPGAISRVVTLEPGIRISYSPGDAANSSRLVRSLSAAMHMSEVPNLTFGDNSSPSTNVLAQWSHRQSDRFNVNLLYIDVAELTEFAWRVGAEFFENRYTIGLVDWALEVFPDEYASAFVHLDEVWATSEFGRQAIVAAGAPSVLAFPAPVIAPAGGSHLARSEFGLPPGALFYSSMDMAEGFDRQNPLGLVEAFQRTFRSGEGPILVVDVVNSDLQVTKLERLRIAASARSDVFILDAKSEDDHSAGLLALADCYVGLHRSEGLNLRAMEAMSLGKPVIATAYSGNLEYLTNEWAYLVGFEFGTVPSGCYPYPKGARWAEPDLDEASEVLRRVVDHPDEAEAIGRRGRQYIEQRRSPRLAASFIRDRFDSAQSELAERFWLLK